MDDLRRRFAALDHVAVPELWDEIETRAGSMIENSAAAQPVSRHRADRRFVLTTRSAAAWIVLVVLLIAALVALAVGAALNDRRLAVEPAPSTMPRTTALPTSTTRPSLTPAATLDCAMVQRWATTPTKGWTSAQQDSSPGVRSSVIATWKPTKDGPIITLIDAVTGGTCPLDIPFAADQGGLILSWSPQRRALAISTDEAILPGGGSRPRLAILSPQGLYRLGIAGTVGWSSDGTGLAVAYTGHSASPGAASVWIVRADGSGQQQLRFDCNPCYPGLDGSGRSATPAWSPDQTRIAFPYHQYGSRFGSTTTESDRTLIATVADGRTTSIERPGGTTFVGWHDDTMLLERDANGTAFGVPLDQPKTRIAVIAAPYDEFGTFSPDGRLEALLMVRKPSTNIGELFVRDLETMHDTKVASGKLDSVIWSPDSTSLIYTQFDPISQQPVPGVWTVNVDGTGSRQLTPDWYLIFGDMWQFAWSAGQ